MPKFSPIFFLSLLALSLVLTACASLEGGDEVVTVDELPAAPTLAITSEPTAEAIITPDPDPRATMPPPVTLTPPASAAGDEEASDQPQEDGTSNDPQNNVYLPFAGGSASASSGDPQATPQPEPTVDFAAARQEIEAQGQEIAYIKTGFHVTLPEDSEVLDDWITRLDEAGVPLFLKTVDNAEPLFKAQELMRESSVPHVLVYRSTGSVPDYELPPQQAAQLHWTAHRDLFPPELDPSLVWIETLNEPDRTRSEWLAQFALETARLAMADGFRWAAFGWASGEPEPEHWRLPAMQEFLRLAGENPERLAIALHEYSYDEEDIGHEYPFKIGRFQSLYEITDQLGIPRPTILITEWGWEYADIPPVEDALRDIKWAAKLYAAYPQVKGAAIWNVGVGCCFGDISQQAQEIIDPLTELSLRTYFAIPREQQPIDQARFQP